jgi:hypothetical protein
MAAGHYAPPRKRKRKVRVFTWIILAINVLFLIWVIAGAASGSGHASNCGSLDQQTCDDAAHTGTAIGVAIIIVLWAAVDLILGIIWLVTRRREPTVVYVQQQAPPPQLPQGGWFPGPGDPPGTLRWWDGMRWTEHVRPQG